MNVLAPRLKIPPLNLTGHLKQLASERSVAELTPKYLHAITGRGPPARSLYRRTFKHGSNKSKSVRTKSIAEAQSSVQRLEPLSLIQHQVSVPEKGQHDAQAKDAGPIDVAMVSDGKQLFAPPARLNVSAFELGKSQPIDAEPDKFLQPSSASIGYSTSFVEPKRLHLSDTSSAQRSSALRGLLLGNTASHGGRVRSTQGFSPWPDQGGPMQDNAIKPQTKPRILRYSKSSENTSRKAAGKCWREDAEAAALKIQGQRKFSKEDHTLLDDLDAVAKIVEPGDMPLPSWNADCSELEGTTRLQLLSNELQDATEVRKKRMRHTYA